MTRNLKALGLALVAAFALSAVVASGASAATSFTSGSDSTILTSKAIGNQVFSTGESTVSCEEVTTDNTTTGTSATEITAEPTYSGNCKITIGSLGTLNATIDMNGCHYLFTIGTEVHILCPEGKQIEVTATILGTPRKCLDIHAQTPTSPVVHYINATNAATGKMDVEVESTVEGITYEKTGSCAFGTIEGNDANYKGKVTITGETGTGAAVDVTVS